MVVNINLRASLCRRADRRLPHQREPERSEEDGEQGERTAVLPPSEQGENVDRGIFLERIDGRVVQPEDGFNLGSRAISKANPDYFGWVPQSVTSFAEVRILRDQGETILAGVVPQHRVGRPIEPQAVDVVGARKEVGKTFDEARREVLVKEELHPFTTNWWRSRSAA